MITEVYNNIHMIELALPNNPLKIINIYIIKGEDKTLIIDTGFNMEECRDGLLHGLKELEVHMSNTELFITHLHADHSGLADMFQQDGVKIYASDIDGILINKMTDIKYWQRYEDNIRLFDLERDGVNFQEHPAYKYCTKKEIDFTYISEGKGIQVGEYLFEVIDIPGHTPGHIGLYERTHKLFFGGDHILDQITANIGFWGFDENILGKYFNSLGKIYGYEIDYLFPSHRNIIKDHTRRINEILSHHKDRLNEILEILKDGESSVRDVAKRMSWRIRSNSWEDFPKAQKWFASEEAMSHLEHLYWTNKVYKNIKDEKVYYKLK